VKTGERFDQARTLLLVAGGGEPSDATALRQHAEEDRNAAVASGIGGPQSAADFGGRDREERDGRLRTRSEKRQFAYLMSTRGRTAPFWRAESTVGPKTGLELRVCKPPSIAASMNQDSKWKIPGKLERRATRTAYSPAERSHGQQG
jgi:hypothetical protein